MLAWALPQILYCGLTVQILQLVSRGALQATAGIGWKRGKERKIGKEEGRGE